MMKRPSLSLIHRQCPLGTCMALIWPQRNGSPHSVDDPQFQGFKAVAFGGRSQAIAGQPELRLPLVRKVVPTVGALSP